MGFGAGALIGALAYELIPRENVSDVAIWLSFGGGALVFYVVDGLITGGASGGESAGREIALGALLDGVPEAVVLGMSVAFGGGVSVGFLVAVFVSNVPEGLSATSALSEHHDAAWTYRLWAAIAIVSSLAGAIGYALGDTMSAGDGRYVQAFAAGAVLTMLADSMMPQAFQKGGRIVAPLTALGFAIAAVLTTIE
jgi:ZIP family zinc transporter